MRPSERIRRGLFIAAGSVFLGLGALGVLVPVLPTTPFLLLAAACYMRGSPKMYRRLLASRLIGGFMRNYLERKGMSLRAKIWTLAFVWASLLIAGLFATQSIVVRVILVVVLVGVTAHIVALKTIRTV